MTVTVAPFDVDALRARFPALAVEHDGRPLAFFDGPGGTQVPQSVIDAVSRYYRESNANAGGAFTTSGRSDEVLAEAHRAMADLLGAADPAEIAFGANMTSLTFHFSRSIGATWQPGDEIVVTTLDHDANVSPWRAVAADRGVRVHTVDIDPADCTLDLGALDRVLSSRTRLVAFGWASNALGTINPVADIVARAHGVGAATYVDAVHWAPHGPIDVQAIGADFLACSVYKFFGPHAGVVYARADVRERLPAYKVRPAHDRFETGTQNHEAQAGTLAAVEYLAGIGRSVGGGPGRRAALVAAMGAVRAYEMTLYRRLHDGLAPIPGLRLYGITDPGRFADRTPTAALTLRGHGPRGVSEELGRRGFATWDGDFYATGLIERLGLANEGGVVRVGLTHYNTADEVDALVAALDDIASR